MTEALDGLTPISLRAAVEALPRRALQSLAKKQGVKANQKSDVLARQLFERFLAEAAAQEAGGSEDCEAAPAGASAGAAGGGLSPVSEGARYSDDGGEEREDCGAAQHGAPVPSPVPDGLAFTPLFNQGGSDQQEAAAGEAGHPAAQEQPEGQQRGSEAAPAATRRVKLLKRERTGGAAAGGGAAGQPRLAGGKRKASVEAPEEAAPPAAKRQARKRGGAGPVAEVPKPAAAANKPASKPAAAKPAMPAALKAANGTRRGPPAKPSSAAASQGQAPPTKPTSAAPSGSKSVAERARLAEERHAARRAAALARAGKA